MIEKKCHRNSSGLWRSCLTNSECSSDDIKTDTNKIVLAFVLAFRVSFFGESYCWQRSSKCYFHCIVALYAEHRILCQRWMKELRFVGIFVPIRSIFENWKDCELFVVVCERIASLPMYIRLGKFESHANGFVANSEIMIFFFWLNKNRWQKIELKVVKRQQMQTMDILEK